MLIPCLWATRMKQVHKAKGSREGRRGGDGAGSCRQRERPKRSLALHAAWEGTTAFKRGKEDFALAVHTAGAALESFPSGTVGTHSTQGLEVGLGGGACRKLAYGQLWSPGEAKLGDRDHMVSSGRNRGWGAPKEQGGVA